MATNPARPLPPEPRRFSIRLPRPLWIGLAAVMLIVVGAGLQVGLPIWRQHAAIREIERVGGLVEMRPGGPEWLRGHLSDDLQNLFDEVVVIDLSNENVTDDTLARLRWLTNVQWLQLNDTQVTDAGI